MMNNFVLSFLLTFCYFICFSLGAPTYHLDDVVRQLESSLEPIPSTPEPQLFPEISAIPIDIPTQSQPPLPMEPSPKETQPSQTSVSIPEDTPLQPPLSIPESVEPLISPESSEEALLESVEPTPYNYAFVDFPISLISPSPTSNKTLPLVTKVRGERACLPGSTRLRRQDGTIVGIGNVSVGDIIEVSPKVYAPVIMLTHADATARSIMVTLRLNNGIEFALSSGHYLPTINKGLVTADEIRVGDILSDNELVVDIQRVLQIGLYNPQTTSGTIRLIDGPTVTAYTEAFRPSAAHAALAPLRGIYAVTGLTMEWVSDFFVDDEPVRNHMVIKPTLDVRCLRNEAFMSMNIKNVS